MTVVTSDSVRATQLRLRANGYGVSVTGILDTATHRAMRRFQDRMDLPVTGDPSVKTWHRLVR